MVPLKFWKLKKEYGFEKKKDPVQQLLPTFSPSQKFQLFQQAPRLEMSKLCSLPSWIRLSWISTYWSRSGRACSWAMPKAWPSSWSTVPTESQPGACLKQKDPSNKQKNENPVWTTLSSYGCFGRKKLDKTIWPMICWHQFLTSAFGPQKQSEKPPLHSATLQVQLLRLSMLKHAYIGPTSIVLRSDQHCRRFLAFLSCQAANFVELDARHRFLVLRNGKSNCISHTYQVLQGCLESWFRTSRAIAL